MSDLVGTPNCWFSHAQAHFIVLPSKRVIVDVVICFHFPACVSDLHIPTDNNLFVFLVLACSGVFVTHGLG